MTITEFLLARISEDEAQAHMSAKMPDYCPTPDTSIELESWCVDCGAGNQMLIHATRVLAECAAKRAIIALHKPITQHWWPEQVPVEVCEMCDDERWECETIRALASVYSGHKDYNWREWDL